MNLVLDIGNTRLKAALFKGMEVVSQLSEDRQNPELLASLKEYLPEIENCIISAVADLPNSVNKLLTKIHIQPLILDPETALPFLNKYHSKNTLGHDRIAAIAGACQLHPHKDVLVIDAGTAITIDLKTSKEEYIGGNISPGLSTRFRALHEYTAKLPLLTPQKSNSLLGIDTNSAIINGVQKGLVFELNGYLKELRNKYPELIVLLTGGDSHFFDNKLKKPIFVVSNLTLIGLNFILRYNAEKY